MDKAGKKNVIFFLRMDVSGRPLEECRYFFKMLYLYVESKKNDTNELNYKIETGSQI